MSTYRTIDGRVRIVKVIRRGDFDRHRVQHGGKHVFWHAFDEREKRWIAQDRFTLAEVKRQLVRDGYCESVKACRLKRERD